MWEYDSPPGSVLPAEAARRTLQAEDPRPWWRAGEQLPVPAAAEPPLIPPLRAEMALSRRCESYFYVAEPKRIKASGTVRGYGGKTFGVPVGDVATVAEGMTLEHFLMLLDRGNVGIGWTDLAAAVDDHRRELGEYRSLQQGAATFGAVVPSGMSSPR